MALIDRIKQALGLDAARTAAVEAEEREKFVNYILGNALSKRLENTSFRNNTYDQYNINTYGEYDFKRDTKKFQSGFTIEETSRFKARFSAADMATLSAIVELFCRYSNTYEDKAEAVLADKNMQTFIGMLPQDKRNVIVEDILNSQSLRGETKATLLKCHKAPFTTIPEQQEFLKTSVEFAEQLKYAFSVDDSVAYRALAKYNVLSKNDLSYVFKSITDPNETLLVDAMASQALLTNIQDGRVTFFRDSSLNYEQQIELFARSVWTADLERRGVLDTAVMYNTQLSAAEINDIHSLTLGSSNFKENIQAGIILEAASDVVEAYYKKIEGDPNAAGLARYWILNKGPGNVERLLPLLNTNVMGDTPDGKKLITWFGENFSSLSPSSKNKVSDLFNQDPTVFSRFPQSLFENLLKSLVEHALTSTSGDNTSLMKSYLRLEVPDLQLYAHATDYILKRVPTHTINFTDFFQNTKNYSNELKECFSVVFTKLIDINNSTQLRIKPIELNINASLINTIPDDHMVVLLKCMQNNDAFKFVNDSKLHLLDYAANNLFSIPADMHSGLLLERFKEVTARLDRSETLGFKTYISRDTTMSPFYPGLWRNFEDAEKVAYLKEALPVFLKSSPLTQQKLTPVLMSMVKELQNTTISALFKDTDSLLASPILQDKRLDECFLQSANPKNLLGYIARNPLRLDSDHDFFSAARSIGNLAVDSLLKAIDAFKDKSSTPYDEQSLEVLNSVLKEKKEVLIGNFEERAEQLQKGQFYGVNNTDPISIIIVLQTILRCNIKAQLDGNTLPKGHAIALSALGYTPVRDVLVQDTIKQNPGLLAAFIHQQIELNNTIDSSYLDAAKKFPENDAVTAVAERHTILENERAIKNKLKERFKETVVSDPFGGVYKKPVIKDELNAVLDTRRINEVVSLEGRQLLRMDHELDVVNVQQYVTSLNTAQCIQRAHNLMHEFNTEVLENTVPARTDMIELNELLKKVIENSQNGSECSNNANLKNLNDVLSETFYLYKTSIKRLSPGPLEQALTGSTRAHFGLVDGYLGVLANRQLKIMKILATPTLETLSVT